MDQLYPLEGTTSASCASQDFDYLNYWVDQTVEKEISRGKKLRELKERPSIRKKEHDVIKIGHTNIYSKKKRRNKCKTSPTRMLPKKESKSGHPRCSLRIAELSVPSKRQCIDTWRTKYHVLPISMIDRLRKHILDLSPVVKIPDAIECFKRHKGMQRKKNKKSWEEKMKREMKKCVNCNVKTKKKATKVQERRYLCAIFGHKIAKALNQPVQITLNTELQKLSNIVSIEIDKLLCKGRRADNKTNENKKVKSEVSGKISIWISNILEETAYAILEDQLKDLEEEVGPVLDLIDDLVDDVVEICEPGPEFMELSSSLGTYIESSTDDERREESPDESQEDHNLSFDTDFPPGTVSVELNVDDFIKIELDKIINSFDTAVSFDFNDFADVENETTENNKELKEIQDQTQQISTEYEDILDQTQQNSTEYEDILDQTQQNNVEIEDTQDQTQQNSTEYEDILDQTQQNNIEIEDTQDQTQQNSTEYEDLLDQTQQNNIEIEDTQDQTQQNNTEYEDIQDQTQRNNIEFEDIQDQTQQTNIEFEDMEDLLQHNNIQFKDTADKDQDEFEDANYTFEAPLSQPNTQADAGVLQAVDTENENDLRSEDDSNKKVKFSDINMVTADDIMDLQAGAQIIPEHVNPDQFFARNDGLLGNTDEPWPEELSPPILRPSESVTKSIHSLGNIMEADEKISDMLEDEAKTKITVNNTTADENTHQVDGIVTWNDNTDTQSQANLGTDTRQLNDDEAINDPNYFYKNKTHRSSTESTFNHDIPTETVPYEQKLDKILEEQGTQIATSDKMLEDKATQVRMKEETNIVTTMTVGVKTADKKVNTSFLLFPRADKSTSIASQSLGDITKRLLRVRADDMFSSLRIKTKVDYKVKKKSASSWVTRNFGEPSDFIYTASEPKEKKSNDKNIRLWCKDLENGFDNLELWNGWIETTIKSVKTMEIMKARICKDKSREEFVRDWLQLKKDVDADVLTWTKLSKSTQEKMKSFRKIYRNVEVS